MNDPALEAAVNYCVNRKSTRCSATFVRCPLDKQYYDVRIEIKRSPNLQKRIDNE